jgi:hypothetical protein
MPNAKMIGFVTREQATCRNQVTTSLYVSLISKQGIGLVFGIGFNLLLASGDAGLSSSDVLFAKK